MQKKNEKNRPVVVLVITIIFLTLLSFFPSNIKILGYEIKPVNLFLDVKPDSLIDYSTIDNNKSDLQKNIASVAEIDIRDMNTKKPIYSSVSLGLLNSFFISLDKQLSLPAGELQSGPHTRYVPISGNVAQMSYFYNAVKNSRGSVIRVAHYGDSGNEGDGVTADIRNDLQKQFGGNGVGMLAITSQDIMFRSTTRQTFSDNWTTSSVVFGNTKNLPLGMNGFVSVPNGRAWVKYEATGAFPDTKNFSTVRIFYTNAKSSSIEYSFNNGASQSAALTPGSGVKELTLNGPKNSTSFKMTATMANQAEFFCVSLEDGNGVYVDNYPWRGNSGISFRDLTESTLNDFSNLCNYKLILLEFGANVVSPVARNYSWYEKEMIKNINNLKKIFPQTSFLMLGMGDKGYKRGSKFVTDPGIPALIESQKRIADETGIAYWNKFDAMGGTNSMEDWVYANPPLALRDYSHLTAQGEKKMGQMIADLILNSYKNFR